MGAWSAKPSGRRGAPRKYTDLAIKTALTLRQVFWLPLPRTEGGLARGLAAQKVEAVIGCKALNRLLVIGRPGSVAIAL